MSSLHVSAAEDQERASADGPLARPGALARIAAVIGFAGALLLQTGLFCLAARFGFGAEPAVLPSPSSSVWMPALGAAMRLGCRPLAERQWRAAAEPGIARTSDAT